MPENRQKSALRSDASVLRLDSSVDDIVLSFVSAHELYSEDLHIAPNADCASVFKT